MKERPILMSAPMVNALLEGRKTQTRRIVKGIPDDTTLHTYYGAYTDGLIRSGSAPRPALAHSLGWFIPEGGDLWPCRDEDRIKCPYGQPGERLWVRENGWERPERTPKMMREGADTWEPYYFDADGLSEHDHEQFKEWGFKRRPSIFMPRKFSRVLLEITDVRIERLQDISEEDAIAEGVRGLERMLAGGADHADPDSGLEAGMLLDPRLTYQLLWESINGPDLPLLNADGKVIGRRPNPARWDANPWVWVISFQKIKG